MRSSSITLEQAAAQQLRAQVLLDPRHREHDVARREVVHQLPERLGRGHVQLHDRLGVEQEPGDGLRLRRPPRASARARKSCALAKQSGAS